MDLEDLIAPSKVSKNGGQSNSSTPISASAPSNNTSRDSEASSNLEKDDKDSEPKGGEHSRSSDQHEDSASRGRRTRSKRPRSGDDFQELVLPERKRELRSSASRLAAAAAARHAAEEAAAKLANESQN